jgi:hypothetical protein
MSVTYDVYYTFIHTLYSLTLIANGISRLLKINGSLTQKRKKDYSRYILALVILLLYRVNILNK